MRAETFPKVPVTCVDCGLASLVKRLGTRGPFRCPPCRLTRTRKQRLDSYRSKRNGGVERFRIHVKAMSARTTKRLLRDGITESPNPAQCFYCGEPALYRYREFGACRAHQAAITQMYRGNQPTRKSGERVRRTR